MPTIFDGGRTVWDGDNTIFDGVLEGLTGIELQNNVSLHAVPNSLEHLISWAYAPSSQAMVWATAGEYVYVVPVTGTYWVAAAGGGGGRRGYTGVTPIHYASGGSGGVGQRSMRLTRGDRIVVRVGAGVASISNSVYGTGTAGQLSEFGAANSIYAEASYYVIGRGGGAGYITSATVRGGGAGGTFTGSSGTTGTAGNSGSATTTGTAPAGGAAVTQSSATAFGTLSCSSGAGQGTSAAVSPSGMVIVAYVGR